MSVVKEFSFRVRVADKNTIVIVDKKNGIAFVVRKLKTKIKLLANLGDVKRVVDVKIKQFEDPNEFETIVCEMLQDTDLAIACTEIAQRIKNAVEEYESYELSELAKKALSEEEPKLVIEDDDTVVEVLKSDGVRIPLPGSVVKLGTSIIVTETTYAYATIRRESKKHGIVEIEDIVPIIAIAVYVKVTGVGYLETRYVLVERKVKAITDRNAKIDVLGRPIAIVSRSSSKDALPTMMSVETLKRFSEGATSRPFREIYRDARSRICKFVVFDDPRKLDVFTCHATATYFYDLFPAFPNLFLYAPYGSGKTRAGLTWAAYARHGLAITDPSEASIYRTIEALNPSIFIDEAVLTPRLMKLLSSGYKQGVKVPRIDRTKNENFILSLFELYSPKCLAYVEPPDEMLLQRCIVLVMKRAEKGYAKRDPTPEDFEDLREELYLARLTRLDEVLKAMNEVAEDMEMKGFSGRDFELWLPILTIAKLAGEDVYQNVMSYALEEIERRKVELYFEEKLILAAIEKMFEEHRADTIRFKVQDLQTRIKEVLIEWGLYDEKSFEKQWKVERIGKILSRMGVRKIKVGKGDSARYAREITRKEFEELCERYGYAREREGDEHSTETKSVRSVGSVSSAGDTVVQSSEVVTSLDSIGRDERSCSTESQQSVGSGVSEQQNLPTYSKRSENRMVKEDRGRHGESVTRLPPQKPTDPTDLTDLRRIEGRFGLIDAIKEILGASPMHETELYAEIMKLAEHGLIDSSVAEDPSIIIKKLEELEKEGIVCKYLDSNSGLFVYYLCPRR